MPQGVLRNKIKYSLKFFYIFDSIWPYFWPQNKVCNSKVNYGQYSTKKGIPIKLNSDIYETNIS